MEAEKGARQPISESRNVQHSLIGTPDTEDGPWGQGRWGKGPKRLTARTATQEPAVCAKSSRCLTNEETARQGLTVPPSVFLLPRSLVRGQ